MKIAVYTSCSLNYYAKARALLESIRRNSPNTSVTLCLCDELAGDCDPLAEGFDRMWQPHDLGYSRAWVFQHNVMELCTGVKGRALQRLMQDESRSEEHTSELQSLMRTSYTVFCLIKKKIL